MKLNTSEYSNLIKIERLRSLLGFVLVLFISWQALTIILPTAIAQSEQNNLSLDQEHLERANRAFINLVNKAKPAVVQITTTRMISNRRQQMPFDEDFFRQWRRFFPDAVPPEGSNEESTPRQREVPGGLGSGAIVSSDGYILTNNHVIEGASDVQVVLSDGREFEAKIIGTDSGRDGTDLALLKIEEKNLPHLTFGDSSHLEVGEWVVAIGSPFGLSQTVTRGIVSAKGRDTNDVSIASYADFIQTDAAINRGNSGGALINVRGQLIGINTAILTSNGMSQGNVGVGFAIPSNLVQKIMQALKTDGEVTRGWLGIQFQGVTKDIAEKYELPDTNGALVVMVGPNSPADKGGLKRGDVIISFDGQQIKDGDDLRNIVADAGAGERVSVKVVRKGKTKNLKIKLGKRTEKALANLQTGQDMGREPNDDQSERFAGMKVVNLTDELSNQYDYQDEEGVVITSIEEDSSAEKAGLQIGDLIKEIDWEPVANIEDYRTRLNAVAKESKILLHVLHSNGRPEYVTLNIK